MRVYFFSVTYFRLEETKKAFDSLLKSFRHSKNSNYLFVGDSNSDYETKEWLKGFQKDNPTNVDVTLFGKNYGKSYIVNRLSQYNNDYDIFVNYDSDIIVPNTDWIDEMVELCVAKKDCGAISVNYTDNSNNPHLVQPLFEKINVCNKHYTLRYGNPVEYIGIGGGCFFSLKENWEKAGKYGETTHFVYGNDDSTFLRNCKEKFKEPPCYVEEIKVYHPIEKDRDYQEWKIRTCAEIQQGKTKIEKGFWDK